MNLLPEENKILFKKYYLRRLFIVFVFLFFSAVFAGIIVLIPTHLLISSHKNDLSAESAAYLKKEVKTANNAAALEIEKLNNRLDFLEKAVNDKKLNIFLKNIFDKKNSGVKITSFSYEKGNVSKIKDKISTDDDKISLYGKARKREDLLIFEGQLKKEWGDQKVVSPVSNLINEKDLDFSLVLYIQNEKKKKNRGGEKKNVDEKSLARLLESVKNEKEAVEAIFLKEDDLVRLIKGLESIRGSSGVSLKISAISAKKKKTSKPAISFSAQGTFEQLFKYLYFLENLPYLITINKVFFQNEEKGDSDAKADDKKTSSTPGWQALFSIQLESYEN